jgi:hypothetical protein
VTQFETEATRLEDLGKNIYRGDEINMEVMTGYALNLLLIIHNVPGRAKASRNRD